MISAMFLDMSYLKKLERLLAERKEENVIVEIKKVKLKNSEVLKKVSATIKLINDFTKEE